MIRPTSSAAPLAMKKFDVEKYLRKNQPPVLQTAHKSNIAVVIPAYDENEHIFQTLDSCLTAARTAEISPLIIIVINYPPGGDPAQSEQLFKHCCSAAFPENCVALYLPALSGGVGAARKAGMDAFIAGLQPEEMENSVIYSLDADTVVDREYFRCTLPELLKGGAVSLPFSHRPANDPALQKAIDRYEAYLRRYVEKLSYAGSPYAFFTIGSSFAVRCDACIRAGGMKIRQAGEDFYFLQAVAKSSGVRQLEGRALVHPSPRVSHRVPFGTGPAVASLLAGGELNEIPDEAFETLAEFLRIITAPGALENFETLRFKLTAEMADFLNRERFFERFATTASDNRSHYAKLRKAFQDWFDGLKTLKFLHFFSDLHNFNIDKR